MIYQNNKPIESLRIGEQIITAVYIGTSLVWSAIKSCFGNGYWINSEVWSNEDSWRNE